MKCEEHLWNSIAQSAKTLERNGETAHCATCDKDFTVCAICPECHQPLQVLKACGAVDYFCQHGHGLISKNALNLLLLNIM